MSILEIIPAVRALSRDEKFRLARLLLDDLAGEELLAGIKQGQEFPLHTPEFVPGAAPQLAALLEEQGLARGLLSGTLPWDGGEEGSVSGLKE